MVNCAACTVITLDYLDRAITLCDSLNKFRDIELNVLIVDKPEEWLQHGPNLKQLGKNITVWWLEDLILGAYQCGAVYQKYKNEPDYLRWALKPYFLSYLLDKNKTYLKSAQYNSVIFCDNDLCFFNNYDFLIDALNRKDILLSPHYRTCNPFLDKFSHREVETNYSDGFFNGGFVGVNSNALNFLNWWKTLCSWECCVDRTRGLFVDQKYLDAVPIYFGDQLEIIQNPGCNLGIWNHRENKRSLKDGQIVINDKYPIIFIHMSKGLFLHYKNNDPLLQFHIEQYQQDLQVSKQWLVQNL